MNVAPKVQELTSSWFDRLFLLLALGLVAGLVFLPVVLVRVYATADATMAGASAEAVVGTAVLLRVAMRRVFRAAARSLFQTTVGTFSRASARTVTRRVVRMAFKSAAMTVKNRLKQDDAAEKDSAEDGFVPQTPLRAVSLAVLALAVSFYGVLWVVGPEHSASIDRLLPRGWAAMLAAAPMVIFSLLVQVVARWQGVNVRFHTALDGLLLQAYFTGAGSFLPLTTDVEYYGDQRATGRVAAVVLSSLLGLHWVLYLLGQWTGLFSIEFLGAMVLIYGFVYSFPLRPLDGHYLWRSSKWQWACLWLAMLVTFLRNVPEVIQGIL